MTRMTVRMLVLRQNLIRAKNSMDLCRDNGEKAIYVRPVERGAYTLFGGSAHARTSSIYMSSIYIRMKVKSQTGSGSPLVTMMQAAESLTRKYVTRDCTRDPFFPAFPFGVPNEFGRRGSSGRNRKEAASSAAR